MCVCVCVCICICICVLVYVCTYVYMFACLCVFCVLCTCVVCCVHVYGHACSIGYTRCYQCPGYSSVLVILPGLAITGLVMGEVAHLQGAGAAPGGHHIHAGGRALLSTEFFPISWDSKTVIGYTLGCVSGILYVTSRLPQICKNVSLCVCMCVGMCE